MKTWNSWDEENRVNLINWKFCQPKFFIQMNSSGVEEVKIEHGIDEFVILPALDM